mmetsp:Transcript_25388/g.61395  ORF Transcript_25388/g.61395 Transcript_25388/m.61395 type:complete len:223 (-) Transcript_25388:488-1156(-)
MFTAGPATDGGFPVEKGYVSERPCLYETDENVLDSSALTNATWPEPSRTLDELLAERGIGSGTCSASSYCSDKGDYLLRRDTSIPNSVSSKSSSEKEETKLEGACDKRAKRRAAQKRRVAKFSMLFGKLQKYLQDTTPLGVGGDGVSDLATREALLARSITYIHALAAQLRPPPQQTFWHHQVTPSPCVAAASFICDNPPPYVAAPYAPWMSQQMFSPNMMQ